MFSTIMTGKYFKELIFIDVAYVEQIMPHLEKSGLDPTKAMKRLNAQCGAVVCEIHEGTLAEYQDHSEERKKLFHIKGVGQVPFYYTIVRVVYVDGYQGYTFRMRTSITRAP